MYHSTQHIDHTMKQFIEYNSTVIDKEYIHHRQININTHHTSTLFNFDVSVKISPLEGLPVLLLKDTTNGAFHTLIIESSIILNKDVPFNILSLSDEASVNIATQIKSEPQYIKLDKEFSIQKQRRQFNIEQIIGATSTLYQEEYYAESVPREYLELLIVENGEITLLMNNNTVTLTKGQTIIIPNKTKVIRNHSAAKRTLTHSIYFIAQKIEPQLFNKTLETAHLIAPLIDALHNKKTHLLTMDYLSIQFNTLIYALYQSLYTKNDTISTAMRERYENDLFNEIIQYIHNSDIVAIKVSDLVKHFNLSRSTLQQLFNRYEHTTPKIYINQLRLEKSRQLIRESNLSITEIATTLGYGSIQYFSRAFSKTYNISPSEYAKGYAKRM